MDYFSYSPIILRDESLYECLVCGAAVAFTTKHIEWHEKLEGAK